MKKCVNIYTEWGKLEEVIIGSHYQTHIDNLDTSMELLFHDNLVRLKRKYPNDSYTIKKKYVDEREEDCLHLIEFLTKECNITVRRPEPIKHIKRFTTPYWDAITKACDNPRDQVLVVDDRIIETSCLLRNRFFENDLLKPILYDYYRQGARWICSPRPMMLEKSFDRCYTEKRSSTASNDFEIMFDAAQCLKFGKDILVNVSTHNHELGFQWLERELGHEFRCHKISVIDNHLDGAIMPLRPGVLLISDKMKGKTRLLPQPLQNWDMLYMQDKDLSKYSEDELLLASNRITVNVLSLDTERILINEHATETIRVLEKRGFMPIPFKFRHSRIFGGGLHCVSLDIRRDEVLEDYFSDTPENKKWIEKNFPKDSQE